jgi:hypothetical protein
MAAPAITAVLASLVAKVEAISPVVDPTQKFRRVSERAPATTQTKRLFDVEFRGHPRDPSNEGRGVQTVGLSDRVAALDLVITYGIGNNEKALETTIAVDSELVLRALGRSANWAGTAIQRAQARSSVDRTLSSPETGEGTGLLQLVVSVDVQYRDQESP